MADYKAQYQTSLNDLLDAHLTSKTVKTISDVTTGGDSNTNPVASGALNQFVTQTNDNFTSVRAEIPTVPTKVSAFTNDVGYLIQHQDISGKVNVSGSRGTLAGYESVSTTTTVNASSADSLTASANVTVEDGVSGTAWTKIVSLTAAVTVTLGSAWSWRGGSAPTIVANGILVCCWCGTFGIANFVSPSA
jgi:hypothetical protein